MDPEPESGKSLDQSAVRVCALSENDGSLGVAEREKTMDDARRIVSEEMKNNGLEAEFEVELPVLRHGVCGRGVKRSGGGESIEANAQDESKDQGLENKDEKKIEIPDSDAASICDSEEGSALSPTNKRDGTVIYVESADEEVKRDAEKKGLTEVDTKLEEQKKNIQKYVEETPKEVHAATEKSVEEEIQVLDTARSMIGTHRTFEMGIRDSPNQDDVRKVKEPSLNGVATTEFQSTTHDETSITNSDSPIRDVDRNLVGLKPQAEDEDHQLSVAIAMAQRALQLYPGSSSQPSQEAEVPEKISGSKDVVMVDTNTLPTEVVEHPENLADQAQSTSTQPIELALPASPTQPRIIPDSDDEDELVSPVKRPDWPSRNIVLAETPQVMTISPKKIGPSTTNQPPSSPQKGVFTPSKLANTPTKTTATQVFSSPSLPPPPPKRKVPPSNLSTSDSILHTELKTIKMASLQSRNASLIAEIAAKKAQLEEVTKKLEKPADETVKRHIRLLHEYNDLRDVGQGLLGLVADNRGVGRVGDLYEEFGVGLKD